MKTHVLNTICDIRENQVDVDKKALEMYDITLKLTSFIAMTNRMGKNQQLKSIDRLRMFFSSDGQKNKHVRSVIYLQEFMRCREPLIKFFGEVEDSKKKFNVIQEKKKKRELEKKKREQARKEKLAQIEKGLRR
jgi:septal ring factor EnvC (AmiA/AmiB activator)